MVPVTASRAASAPPALARRGADARRSAQGNGAESRRYRARLRTSSIARGRRMREACRCTSRCDARRGYWLPQRAPEWLAEARDPRRRTACAARRGARRDARDDAREQPHPRAATRTRRVGATAISGATSGLWFTGCSHALEPPSETNPVEPATTWVLRKGWSTLGGGSIRLGAAPRARC